MARKGTSRTARWAQACGDAREAFDAVREARQAFMDQVQELWDSMMTEPVSKLGEAMGALLDVQAEYQEWYDGMSENLQNSATGEKLQAVTELDLEFTEPDEPDFDVSFDLDTVESQIEDADASELPQGYGRD